MEKIWNMGKRKFYLKNYCFFIPNHYYIQYIVLFLHIDTLYSILSSKKKGEIKKCQLI